VQGLAESEAEVDQARVLRKVARRLVPLLTLAFFLNFVNRTNISVSKLRMNADFGLTEAMYGLASGLFFIGYVPVEVPSNVACPRYSGLMLPWMRGPRSDGHGPPRFGQRPCLAKRANWSGLSG
jgi:hypothetical protein